MLSPTLDLALLNGRIWGSDGATAVGIRGNRIVAVGTSSDVREACSPQTQVRDLSGRIVLPAFTDSHTHYHRTAILQAHFLDFASLAPRALSDVLAAVTQRAAEMAAGTWIQGDNLMDSALEERRFPTRYELDLAAPAHPVLLRGTGKHVIAANSLALRLAGIDAHTPDPPGGRIDRNAEGEPTGVLHERAKLRLDTTRSDTVVPPLTEEQRLSALAQGMRRLQALGLSSIHEITRTPEEFGDYLRLRNREQPGIRVVSYVRVIEGQAQLDDLLNLGLRSGFGDDWLRLGGVKVSIDGSCTFRNAATYDPYPGFPDNRGLVRIEQGELDEVVRRSHAAGLQVAVHAIGPRAVDMALEAFTAAAPLAELRALRHRLEHAYLPPRPGQLERVRDLGLVLSTQPAFIDSVGEIWREIFGDEAVRQMVPLRTALDLGIPVLANSDCPTSSPDPLVGLRTAVLRRTSTGWPLGQQQAVTVEEALQMLIVNPTFAASEESHRGSVEVGKLADLVVLNSDLADVSAEALSELAVDATVVDGTVVFERSFSEGNVSAIS